MADRLILDLTGSFAIYMAKHTVTHIHTPWMLTSEQVLRVTREGAVPHPLLNILFQSRLEIKVRRRPNLASAVSRSSCQQTIVTHTHNQLEWPSTCKLQY